jgi:DNA-binding NarL/FixJ family response regulator
MTLLLIDDHELFRDGLRAVLSTRADFKVIGEAGTVADGFTAYQKHLPDVTLLDLKMPDGTGLEVLGRIRTHSPQARVLMLTTYDGDEDIHRAISSGASGYLLKSIPSAQLFEAIKAVHEGRRYFPPAVKERLAEREAFEELTPREIEVLSLIAKGMSNKNIASVLKASEFTIKSHVRNILAKLGVEARTEAAMIGIQRGVIQI